MNYLITNKQFDYDNENYYHYDIGNNFKFIINKNIILNSIRGIIFKNDDNILDLIIGNIRKDDLYINESINNNISLDGYNGIFTRIYINKTLSKIYVFKNSKLNKEIYFCNLNNLFAISDDLKFLSKITKSSINNNIASEVCIAGKNLSNVISKNVNYVDSLFNNIYLLQTNKILGYNYNNNILYFSKRIPSFKNNKFDILSNIYDAYYNNLKEKIYILSFTGGMDSRLGLSILLSKNLQKNLVLNYGFEEECEKKCVIDICKQFDLTLIIRYQTINGIRLKRNLCFSDEYNYYNTNTFDLKKIINNFNIDNFSKFNILNRSNNGNLLLKMEHVIENLSSHHKNMESEIKEYFCGTRKDNKGKEENKIQKGMKIIHTEGEFYKGLFFQRQAWPTLDHPKKNKIKSLMNYMCKSWESKIDPEKWQRM